MVESQRIELETRIEPMLDYSNAERALFWECHDHYLDTNRRIFTEMDHDIVLYIPMPRRLPEPV